MTVFEIDPLQDSRWKELVENNPKASVFHRSEWLQALKCAYGYEPVALSLCPPTSRLTNGVVFCRIRSKLTGKRLVSLPFSDHCEPLVENKDEADCLVTSLKDVVNDGNWKYLEIRPVSSTPWEAVMPVVTSAYYSHSLDLRRSEEQLFRSFHKDSVQRKIRRADRELLRYVEGTSDTHLDQFYKLLVLTRRRHCVPPQPLKWFRNLISSFGTDLKIRVALKNDTPIASILTLSHSRTITYKYGCSDPEFQNLGGTALLFWRTIMEAKAKGFEQFDLGRSDTNNPGLVEFKDRWAAERSILSYRRYPVQSIAPEERKWAGWVIRRLVSSAPDASLITLGNLLYRHIG